MTIKSFVLICTNACQTARKIVKHNNDDNVEISADNVLHLIKNVAINSIFNVYPLPYVNITITCIDGFTYDIIISAVSVNNKITELKCCITLSDFSKNYKKEIDIDPEQLLQLLF